MVGRGVYLMAAMVAVSGGLWWRSGTKETY